MIIKNRNDSREQAETTKLRRPSKAARYRAFAEAFLNAADSTTYLNVYKSAIAAGYTQNYAAHGAYRLMENVGVIKELEAIKAEKRGDPLIADATEVLRAMTAHLRVLPNRLFDSETGVLTHPSKMTDEVAQAVAGFEIIERIIPNGDDQPTRELRTKLKLVDRQTAAQDLAKYWGLFDKDNRQKAPPAPVALVNFPSRELSLEEWQAAAIAILDAQDKAKASCP